jgi:hypothetical protein
MPLRSPSAPQAEAERRPLQEHIGSTDNAIQLHFLLVRIAVMRTSQSPLKAIFTLQKSEVPLALLMFSYFFLVITSFWILKPIKKALFIEYYDQTGFDLLAWHLSAPQAELLAKVLNMVVSHDTKLFIHSTRHS